MTTKTSRRSRKYHPVTDLPFVEDTPNGRNFWSVKKPKDPWQQSALGGAYALAWLRYEAMPENDEMDTALASIVSDMPRKIDHLEIAFLSLVGFAAKYGRSEAERIEAYYRRRRAERLGNAA